MENVAELVLAVKAKVLRDRHASDRALAEHWGVSTSAISNARYGECTDKIAYKIADVLQLPPGQVLWAARTAREKNPVTKVHLEMWAERVGKALRSVPQKALGALAALGVALSVSLFPHDAMASVGGAGGRRHT